MKTLDDLLASRGLMAPPFSEDFDAEFEPSLVDVLLGSDEGLRVEPDRGRIGVWVIWLGDRPVVDGGGISSRGAVVELSAAIEEWRAACRET